MTAQQVAGGNVRDAEGAPQDGGLRALAGAGRAKKHDAHENSRTVEPARKRGWTRFR
jgi:hypothetical protein